MSDDAPSNVLPFGPGEGQTVPSRGEEGGGIGSGVVSQPETELDDYADDEFGANLAERLDEGTLSQIATEVIEGVQADIDTRADLIEQYELGIELLGTRIEDISTPATAGKSISRVGHPLLIESMIKAHAGAEAEMLPAEGPAKVMTIGDPAPDEEQLAADFESDLNYYLTEVAKEYYKDTS